MANTKISALTSATTPLAGTEVLPIVQSGATVKVASDDLTVRNIRANATTGILQITGPAAASTRVATVPNANWTAARTDAAQSFTGDQTLATGNIIQGTAAKGFNFTANTPAAGMTSQLFNWYEQGTFTPTIEGSTTAGTASYTYQIGRYTRLGNRVAFTLRVGWSSGTGTGNLIVAGLPVASANVTVGGYSSVHVFPVAASNITLTASNVAIAVLGPNSTKINVEQQPSDTSVAYDGAGALIITGTYEV